MMLGDIISQTRRVVKQGNSYYVSLPPEFVRSHQIKPGDLLPVIANHIVIIRKPTEETPVELNEKVECPYCHSIVLASALVSHIKNYCKRAPAEVKAG